MLSGELCLYNHIYPSFKVDVCHYPLTNGRRFEFFDRGALLS